MRNLISQKFHFPCHQHTAEIKITQRAGGLVIRNWKTSEGGDMPTRYLVNIGIQGSLRMNLCAHPKNAIVQLEENIYHTIIKLLASIDLTI